MSRGSSLRPAERVPRGRAVVVGADADSFPALPRPTTMVDNLFEAIGEVAAATAGQPVAFVLVCAHAAPQPLDQSVDAIRRVDPAVPIFLIMESSTPDSPEFDTRTFDETFILPDDINRLRTSVDLAGTESLAHDHCSATAEDAPGTDDVVDSTTNESAPTGNPEHQAPLDADSPAAGVSADTSMAGLNAAPSNAPPRDPQTETAGPDLTVGNLIGMDDSTLPLPIDLPGQVTPAYSSEPSPTGELGDVDLVDAVLDRTLEFREVALRLISQHTGWTNIQMLDVVEAAHVAPTCAYAEIMVHDKNRGWLMCDECSTQQLEPWARWIGRWLTLEQTYCEYQQMAFRDDLTGAWNRRFFNMFLGRTLSSAQALRRPITVMVFDIDNFKQYNDRFGHQAGDVILAETVRLLNSVIRQGDRVCRIGGDEFAVIFSDLEGPREVGSSHPSTPEQIAVRFQSQICQTRFPKLGMEAPGNLSISAGLATYPWDGVTAEALLQCADTRALQSKRGGKNAITFGPGEEHEAGSGV